MQESHPAAVLFDMDGTLVDSEHLWLSAEIEVMEQLGSHWTEQDQANCLGGPLGRVADYMVSRSGTASSPTEVGSLLLKAIETRMRNEPLIWRPGALEMLLEVHRIGIATALVTASWEILVETLAGRMREEVGSEPFDVWVTGDLTKQSKPHPEPYLTAASMLGVAPSDCLAIEDSPTGVRSALAAGCVVVAVPHIAPLPNDLRPSVVVDTLLGQSVRDLWVASTSP